MTGALPGRSPETLFAMDCLSCELSPFPGWPSWTFEPTPIIGSPAVSANVFGLFGGPGGHGQFVIEFSTAAPGSPTTLTSASIVAQSG